MHRVCSVLARCGCCILVTLNLCLSGAGSISKLFSLHCSPGSDCSPAANIVILVFDE